MIPAIEPYVPATVINIPVAMTNTLQKHIRTQRTVGALRPSAQLSYSHMHPYGWNVRTVPRRAPMSETRPSKTGIALAIT